METSWISATNRNIATAIFGLFITLACWSFSSSIGSGGDIDAHISSIWCAWGEEPGMCENDTGSIASVPYMFQMCNGRPIDSMPGCEVAESSDQMQTLRIMGERFRSPYYAIMRVFATKNPQQSILTMRLVNSFIATVLMFGLLKLTSGRVRLAAISGLSFTLIPVAVARITSVNPHSWAIMGVMTSWAFLHAFLIAPKEANNKKLLLAFYIFTVLLSATTRVDATTYVVFTSAIVLLHRYMNVRRISLKEIAVFVGASTAGIAIFMRSERIRSYLTLSKPTEFPFNQYLLFQVAHIPESLVEVFGYAIGQQGNGPGLVGIIGLSLFVTALIFSWQSATRVGLIFVGLIMLFLAIVMYKGSVIVNSLIPLPGTYALGLMTFLLGMSVITSQSEQQFMSRKGNRIAAISLLSITHALTLYSWMELYTHGNQTPGFFNSQTLDASNSLSLSGGWWWNTWSSPNWVFLTGIVSFPVFLHFAWRVVGSDLTTTEVPLH
jgi:hypothetical protein